LHALAATEMMQQTPSIVPSSTASSSAAPLSPPESLPSRAYELLASSRDAVIVELLRFDWTTAVKRRGYSTRHDGGAKPAAAAADRPLTIVERLARDAGKAYTSIEMFPMRRREVEYVIVPDEIDRAMVRLKQQLQRQVNFSARARFPHMMGILRTAVWGADD
jgi:hypothetical protein